MGRTKRTEEERRRSEVIRVGGKYAMRVCRKQGYLKRQLFESGQLAYEDLPKFIKKQKCVLREKARQDRQKELEDAGQGPEDDRLPQPVIPVDLPAVVESDRDAGTCDLGPDNEDPAEENEPTSIVQAAVREVSQVDLQEAVEGEVDEADSGVPLPAKDTAVASEDNEKPRQDHQKDLEDAGHPVWASDPPRCSRGILPTEIQCGHPIYLRSEVDRLAQEVTPVEMNEVVQGDSHQRAEDPAIAEDNEEALLGPQGDKDDAPEVGLEAEELLLRDPPPQPPTLLAEEDVGTMTRTDLIVAFCKWKMRALDAEIAQSLLRAENKRMARTLKEKEMEFMDYKDYVEVKRGIILSAAMADYERDNTRGSKSTTKSQGKS